MINIVRYGVGVVLFCLPFYRGLLKVKHLSVSLTVLTILLVALYYYFRWTGLLLKKFISVNIGWEKLLIILQKKDFFIDEKQTYPIIEGQNFKFTLHEKTSLVKLTGQLILEGDYEVNFHCFLAESLLQPLLEKLTTSNFLTNNIQFERKMVFSYFKSFEGLITLFVMIMLTFLAVDYIFIRKQNLKEAFENFWRERKKEIRDRELLKDMTKPILPDESFPSFRDIGGYDNVKIALQTVAEELKNESGIGIPRGFVLYGPPGTGKTMMAKAFAKEAGLTFFKVSGNKISSGLVAQQRGASKDKLYSLLEAAAKHAKQKKRRVVVFIDEIEMMDAEAKIAGVNLNKLANNTGNGSGGTEFRDIIDGDDHEKFKDIIFIVTTNNLSWFDRAALRSGRLEEKYCMDEPEGDDLKVIVDIYIEKHKSRIPNGLKQELAEKIVEKIRDKGFVGATINSIFENLDLARKRLNKIRNSNNEENDWEVFERAIERIIEIEETSKGHRDNIFDSFRRGMYF
jgi:ATP-dependent 26S proteasome regulatory subunit